MLASSLRFKRNADNYGTLQPIDEKSLLDLRKMYKDTLKEITLNPDEDPTEALMRYNAASIREALQRANHEPVEVSAGGDDEHSVDTHSATNYFKQSNLHGAEKNFDQDAMTASAYEGYKTEGGNPIGVGGKNEETHGYTTMIVPEQHSNSNSHSNLRQHSLPAQHSQVVYTMPSPSGLEGIGSLDVKSNLFQPHTETFYRPESQGYSKPTVPQSLVAESMKEVPAAKTRSNTQKDFATQDVEFLMKFVKERLTNCCEKCKDSIMSDIKNDNKSSENSDDVANGGNKSDDDSLNKNKRSQDRASALDSSNDPEYQNWLNEMSAKGFDSNYLTKYHQSKYSQNRKLGLFMDSSEDNFGVRKAQEKSLCTKDHSTNKKYFRCNHIPINKGRGFGKSPVDIESDLDGRMDSVNDELINLKYHSMEEQGATPNGYALRGKLLQRKSEQKSGKTLRAATHSSFKKLYRSTKSPQHYKNYLDATTIKVPATSPLTSDTENGDYVNSKQAKMQELLSMLTELKIVNGTQIVATAPTAVGEATSTVATTASNVTQKPRIKRRRRKNK